MCASLPAYGAGEGRILPCGVCRSVSCSCRFWGKWRGVKTGLFRKGPFCLSWNNPVERGCQGSVASGPENTAFRHASGEDAGCRLAAAQLAERDAADGNAQPFSQFFFFFRRPVPRHLEPVCISLSGEVFFQFPQSGGGADMGVPEGNGPLKQGVLDALENIRSGIDQFRFRDEGFSLAGRSRR